MYQIRMSGNGSIRPYLKEWPDWFTPSPERAGVFPYKVAEDVRAALLRRYRDAAELGVMWVLEPVEPLEDTREDG